MVHGSRQTVINATNVLPGRNLLISSRHAMIARRGNIHPLQTQSHPARLVRQAKSSQARLKRVLIASTGNSRKLVTQTAIAKHALLEGYPQVPHKSVRTARTDSTRSWHPARLMAPQVQRQRTIASLVRKVGCQLAARPFAKTAKQVSIRTRQLLHHFLQQQMRVIISTSAPHVWQAKSSQARLSDVEQNISSAY